MQNPKDLRRLDSPLVWTGTKPKRSHVQLSFSAPSSVCDRISPAATQPRSSFSSSLPLLLGLSASTPVFRFCSSTCFFFSTLVALHIIWHQRGRDKSRCLPSLAGAHYKNIKISRAERQDELMISLCHWCPSPPPSPKWCQAIWRRTNTCGGKVEDDAY